MDVLRSRRIIVALLLLGIAGGCGKTREIKVGRFQPADQAASYVIPRSGVYKVKWKVRDDLKGIDSTMRFLPEGAVVGFESLADGTVIALADGQRVDVGPFPRRATYACWYQKSHEETQFAREIKEAFAALGEVGQVIVISTAIGAGAAGVLLLKAEDDHDRFIPSRR